jgi:hypothetical protein
MKRRAFLAASAMAVAPASWADCKEDLRLANAWNTQVWTQHRRARDYLASPGRSANPPDWDDHRLVTRLLAAYRRTFSYAHYGDGMWRTFFEKRHKNLHQVFMSGDAKEASKILRVPTTSELHYGYDETTIEPTRKFLGSVQDQANHAVACKMHLVTLAEALGVTRLENPETYPNVPASLAGPETEGLLTMLDGLFGIRIEFPNPFPDEFGLQTARGVAGYRAIHALYQAYRIRSLAPRSVVEVGGGMGRTAYYGFRLGLRDYTIVDLPFTAIAHGYFLGCLLGQDAVVLDGEPHRRDAIKLQSPDTFLASTRKYDLFVNVDSLTEIPPVVARPYYDAFRRRGKRLLSINHEFNSHRVHGDLWDVKHSRFPYWMRRGYVEELYSLS